MPFCSHLCNVFSASLHEKTAPPAPAPPRDTPGAPAPLASICPRPRADCRLLEEKALCAGAGWKRRGFNNPALFGRNSSAEIPSRAGERGLGRSRGDAAARGCGGEGDAGGTETPATGHGHPLPVRVTRGVPNTSRELRHPARSQPAAVTRVPAVTAGGSPGPAALPGHRGQSKEAGAATGRTKGDEITPGSGTKSLLGLCLGAGRTGRCRCRAPRTSRLSGSPPGTARAFRGGGWRLGAPQEHPPPPTTALPGAGGAGGRALHQSGDRR